MRDILVRSLTMALGQASSQLLGLKADSLRPASCVWYAFGSCGPQVRRYHRQVRIDSMLERRASLPPYLSCFPVYLRPSPCVVLMAGAGVKVAGVTQNLRMI